eukprot:TRINITY_DN12823_c0_g1_i1.p1 TRINITY_DN12823_c0_g1~~TRINITY_DN12823_c0_g1_i1.p1  ORF type:complete len:382 (+),score=54.63 TRINITY_DN12823_c0_g1_i1:67-1212(+)
MPKKFQGAGLMQLKTSGSETSLRSEPPAPQTCGERLHRFALEWKLLSSWSRHLARVVLVEGIGLILFELVVIALLRYANLYDSNVQLAQFTQELAYGLVVIVNSIFFVYFAFDAIFNENRFELSAFALTSLVLCGRLVWFFVSERGLWLQNTLQRIVEWMALACMVVVIIMQLLIIWFSVQAWRAFGWKMWKEIRNADKSLLYAFGNYQAYLSALKIDLQFGCSLLILAAFFLYDPSTSYALYVVIAVIVLSFVWAFYGRYCIRREWRLGMIPFLLFCLAEPTYIIYKIVQLYGTPNTPSDIYEDCTYVPCLAFAVYGSAAIIIRLLLFFFAIRCWRRFDRGLKRVFGTEAADGTQDAASQVAMGPTHLTASATLNQRLLV